MASVKAFNDMLLQFLNEMKLTFPDEETNIEKYNKKLELAISSNPNIVPKQFISKLSPYQEKISERDETLFTEDASKIDILKEINFSKNWNDSSENNKNAIWQYVQTLYMLGTTINTIPKETLNMIEKVAKECADKFTNDENGGKIDEEHLMKSMQGLLGGMLKK